MAAKRVRFIDPAGSIRDGVWSSDEVQFTNSSFDPNEVDILPPIEPSKIVCVGLNYYDHAEESNLEVPDRPLLFMKGPNTVSGHGRTVDLPPGKLVHYEAEIGVVIGEQCRNVDASDAMDVVAGFTCVNDISNRDDQRNRIGGNMDFVRGKAFDNSSPIGPVVASPDAVPNDAHIRLWVNGDLKQDSSRSNLVFAVPELIEDITNYLTLESGDVIATGTPAGVGPLSDGDTVEIEVEGVGRLEHRVTQSKS